MEYLAMIIDDSKTIAAIATPAGSGGVAMIRLSGPQALDIVSGAWRGKSITDSGSRMALFGRYEGLDGNIVDEIVLTWFKAPASFTGEDTIEISMHGSQWIQREILADLIKRGARIANPGEFTQRAFLNGKIDLAQAEAIADLIASQSKAAHDLAIKQLKGAFSKEFENLRAQLIEFASLLELELDFSEEDVEFADRTNLLNLLDKIINKIAELIKSFSTGEAIKDGIPVVIAGLPNVGKSSLLNLLLHDDKAIVTDIPGTTRDLIEEKAEIDGILYRFTDTAGLHETNDPVEKIGIERARETLKKAAVVIWIIDPTSPIDPQLRELNEFIGSNEKARLIILRNKTDLNLEENVKEYAEIEEVGIIPFSTVTRQGLDELLSQLHQLAISDLNQLEIIVSNVRHYEALAAGLSSLERAREALTTGLSSDFISQDIREAVHHLSTITGSISTPDLLHNIFSSFCIGK